MSVEGSDDEGAQDQDDENIPSDESGEFSAEGSNLESDFESEEEMPWSLNFDGETSRFKSSCKDCGMAVEATEFSRIQTLQFLSAFQPKDFYHIASHVAGNCPAQCVDHYYLLKGNDFDFQGLIAAAVIGAESALSFTSLPLPLTIHRLGVATRFNHTGETASICALSPTMISSPDEAPTKSGARIGWRRATHARVASIDADQNVRFQNSCRHTKIPAPIKWSLHEQEEFNAIVSQNFRGVLPNLALPVGGDVLLAFKRIAAQTPRMTTAQVLNFTTGGRILKGSRTRTHFMRFPHGSS
ncbi:hypothetical protein B0H14DRAFT_3141060 [Mycena olivaceomarginata]|nr:hypothetical protein B0H14DRAFT_3141060 [Mycena olivaceomarginata]